MNRFPYFGKELRRPFEVHENCYDCASFYDGCKGWRASRDFECWDFNRLPDVMPGTCGQTFPPSRRRARPELEPEPIEPEPAESRRPTAPEPDTASIPAIEACPGDPPTSRSSEPRQSGVRTCGCGADLPKGKRLCPTCRTEARRRTKRRYMRAYMKEHRPPAVGSDPDVPFTHAGTHATRGNAEDLPLTRPTLPPPHERSTSVLTPAKLQTGPGEPPNPDGRHADDESLGTHLQSLNSTHGP